MNAAAAPRWRRKLSCLLLAAGLAALTAAAAHAQSGDRHALLKRFESEGGKIEFLGNAYGLDGWLITNDKGNAQYAYTTPQGGLVIGMLFSPEGLSETKKQLLAYKQRTEGGQAAVPGGDKAPSKAERLYAETEKAAWVSLGNPQAAYLYAFINVNCDHCQGFWQDVEGMVKEGRLQVRLVPFGKIAENRDGGAALLSADQPAEAWSAYLAGDKSALDKGKIKDGAYDRIDQNSALVKSWNLDRDLPFILYRRPSDSAIIAVVGRPRNPLLLQAEFTPLETPGGKAAP